MGSDDVARCREKDQDSGVDARLCMDVVIPWHLTFHRAWKGTVEEQTSRYLTGKLIRAECGGTKTLRMARQPMPTNEEIFEKVQATLIDALGVDEEDVTPDATLFGKLGAESIDLLDIVFRLERNFGIKIPRGELFPENFSDPELVQDGKLTAKGLDEIRGRMPYADLTQFAADPQVEKLFDLYTVDMLVQYVASKLQAA
jgi:acyl carrier protein